jgi:hypothetical protein
MTDQQDRKREKPFIVPTNLYLHALCTGFYNLFHQTVKTHSNSFFPMFSIRNDFHPIRKIYLDYMKYVATLGLK